MNTHRILLLTATPLMLAFLLAPKAISGDVPPQGSKALSTILKATEADGIGVITEAEFEKGQWKIKTHKDGKRTILYFDPSSGKESRRTHDQERDEMPPANALKLSKIVKSIEDENQGTITEIEFDDGYWECELDAGGKEIEFDVDPVTGKRRG